MPEISAGLKSAFGGIDVYLFDQLLRGRFDNVRTVLDVGCGSGRNLPYLLRGGFDVYAVDKDPEAVEKTRAVIMEHAPSLSPDNVRVANAENLPFPDACFDAVLCSAVLHFAEDDRHFDVMLKEIWRVVAPGGILFARLASNIGMERRAQNISGRRYALPDGTERYLVDEMMLLEKGVRLGGDLIDPIKTTNVQNQRCMTTWVLRKP